MRGATPPFPNTPSLRGAQLKAQGQLYLHLYRYKDSNMSTSRLMQTSIQKCQNSIPNEKSNR